MVNPQDFAPTDRARVLLLTDSQNIRETISTMLWGEPDIDFGWGRVGATEGIQATKRLRPDIILLATDQDQVVRLIEELDLTAPYASIITMLDREGPDLAAECLLAGARLCVSTDVSASELIEGIRRLYFKESRRRQTQAVETQAGNMPLGHVISIHGSKGGIGKTTIATNLAIVMKQVTGKKIALADLNLQAGDVAVTLSVVTGNSISELLPHLGNVDEDMLAKIMFNHESGVKILIAPLELEEVEGISGEQVQQVLAALRSNFDYVIVDTAPVLNQTSIAALDASDTVVMVTTPEMATLRNTSRLIQLMERFGYPPDKVLLCINRAKSYGSISLPDVEHLLQRKAAVTIRSDWRMIRASNEGRPMVMAMPQSEFTVRMRDLASVITGVALSPVFQGSQAASTVPPEHNGHGSTAVANLLLRGRSLFTRSLLPTRHQENRS